MNLEHAKIPKLWGFFANSSINKVNSGVKAYTVYYNFESDVSGLYDVIVGSLLQTEKDTNDLSSITIQNGAYLCFRNQGDFPQVVIETWQIIWKFFSDHPECSRTYQTDFEVYLENNTIEVNIGIIN